MNNLYIDTWSELKSIASIKNCKLQYVTRNLSDKGIYEVFFIDGGVKWTHEIDKLGTAPDPSDQKDFEDNYKAGCNKSIDYRDINGKLEVTRSSRPEGTLTYFAGASDSGTQIGEGKKFMWNFADAEDDITAPAGFKRKRLEITFLDKVYLKEGMVFFKNKTCGSYCNFYVVCPSGQYYLDNNKVPQLAGSDTIVEHYVSHLTLIGDAPNGIKLDTESAQAVAMPTNYKIWAEITVPDTDVTSCGGFIIEMYRTRNRVL